MRAPSRRRARLAVAVLAATAALALAACQNSSPSGSSEVGDVDLGKEAMVTYGCGSCHTIPGVPEANALVGPPLTQWSQRTFIAGQLSNTPDNLVRWIRDPQGVEPGTAMPDLGVSTEEARNIAAYLLELE